MNEQLTNESISKVNRAKQRTPKKKKTILTKEKQKRHRENQTAADADRHQKINKNETRTE